MDQNEIRNHFPLTGRLIKGKVSYRDIFREVSAMSLIFPIAVEMMITFQHFFSGKKIELNLLRPSLMAGGILIAMSIFFILVKKKWDKE